MSIHDICAGMTLSTAGNVGSIIGALFTFVAFVAQIRKRRQYMLMIRGKELRDDLINIGKRLNRYETLSPQEKKTVVSKTRMHVAYAATYLSWSEWWGLWPMRVFIFFRRKAVNVGTAENYYANVQSVIVALENRIRDQEVKQ
jgi:flagellar biosynthesis chaperone FliJ